jgi:hypothetical protein
MTLYKNLLLILLFAVNGDWCAPAVNPDKYEYYIKSAIFDFLKKSPLSKKDSVFSIIVKEFDNEIIGINIYGSTRKPVIVRH